MISNSTCMILLSKINKLNLLKEVYGQVIITEAVRDEILIVGKPGFAIINQAIKEGWIKVMKGKSIKHFGLGKGENETIQLALELKGIVISDDIAAINLALSLGIETERTTSVILKAYKKGMLSSDETIETINELIEAGYYIAPRHYIKLVDKIKHIS